jgi:hypothetical protein
VQAVESQYKEHSNAFAAAVAPEVIEEATISAEEPMMPTVHPEPSALQAVEVPEVG